MPDAADSAPFERFLSVLRELFLIDSADLDFGIYRIMNAKRSEIEGWLGGRLRERVVELVERNASSGKAELEKELSTAVKQAEELGADPESLPKVLELREQLKGYGDSSEFENEVYSRLAEFFRRYYDGGDFLTKRRYRKDSYAVPYSGEETKLYWSNAEQYYVKTAEFFRSYAFRLRDGRRVCFALREADSEQNSNKLVGDRRRLFALARQNAVLEKPDGSLEIGFVYAPFPKSVKQSELADDAYSAIREALPASWREELLAPSQSKSGKSGVSRTVLRGHIANYMARNSFDYFIHKGLRGFLSRELDFYVKSEMLCLDDIDDSSDDWRRSFLSVAKAVRAIGAEIIDFLSSLEDFQKRLWEKRKFVVSADYCISLDQLPKELYGDICANAAQREEWVRLFAIDEIGKTAKGELPLGAAEPYSVPLTEKFLEENQSLPVDTAFFGEKFKRKALSAIPDLDGQTTGVLANSENYQALRAMRGKYAGKVKCCYIDPPYNTGNDGFLYKDGFPHSTWLAMMEDRLREARTLLAEDGAIFISIDDHEQANLKLLCDKVFGEDNFVGNIAWRRTDNQPNTTKFAKVKDSILLYSKVNAKCVLGKLSLSEKARKEYRYSDKNGLFRRAILLHKTRGRFTYDVATKSGGTLHGPWMVKEEKFQKMAQLDEIYWTSGGDEQPYGKIYLKDSEGQVPCDFWDIDVGSNQRASIELESMFGNRAFDFPKPTSLLKSIVNVGGGSLVLDFFAGSGTSGHAAIELNREDGGSRKFLLVEMGEYFGSVTKPRVLKAAYSKSWKDGRPTDRSSGLRQLVKCVYLEQYDDTLGNLVPKAVPRPGERELVFGKSFEESRLLGYFLDTETSGGLFDHKWFERPFDIEMKICRGGVVRSERIDLPETFAALLGLHVERRLWPKDGLELMTGRLPAPSGSSAEPERVLVVWRDQSVWDPRRLDEFFQGAAEPVALSGYDRIFANGDVLLERLRAPGESWHVELTDEVFLRKMFE